MNILHPLHASQTYTSAFRREQEKAAWELAAVQEQLRKAEASAADTRAECSASSANLQARLRELERASVAAELELERERLKREGSESKRLVSALDEVALLQRQLASVRGDADRAAATEERLRADKDSLDAALTSAQAEVHAAHRQAAKVTDELTEELTMVRLQANFFTGRMHASGLCSGGVYNLETGVAPFVKL